MQFCLFAANNFMEEQLKPNFSTIFSIGFPLFLGNLAWTFVTLTDQAFMGQVGRVEEAAIGPVSIFYSLIVLLGFGFSRGTQLLVANKLGENKKHEIGKIMDNTLLIMVVFALIIFVVVYFGSHYFLQLTMSDQAIIEKGNTFVQIRIWGIIASFLSSILIAFYSGLGQTTILTFSVGLMSLLNIFLNYVFVFGKYGCEPMGIEGSALASTISEYCSFAVLFAGLFLKKRNIDFALFTFKSISFSFSWYMTKIATPLILQSILANGAWFIFYTKIEKMGQNNLAIANYMRSLIMFIGISVWTLGTVTNTIVSNLVGQNKKELIKIALFRISAISFIAVVIQGIVLLLFPHQILRLFTVDETQILAAIPSLIVIVIAMLLMGFANIIFSGVVSLGNTNYALYIEFVSIVLYCIYFMFLFTFPDIKVATLWTTEWVYWTTTLLLSIYFLYRNKIQLIR